MSTDQATKGEPRAALSRMDIVGILGHRWCLPILLSLRDRPMRFSDLRRDLPGLSAKILTLRLRELEAIMLITRRNLPFPATGQVYSLSSSARDLRPMLDHLADWLKHWESEGPGAR